MSDYDQRRQEVIDAIHLGLTAEKDPALLEANVIPDLTERQIEWLGSWLASEGIGSTEIKMYQLDVPWSCCGAPHDAEEHKPDCPDRCPHCGSEGIDLDHKEGCPTLGTCAQTFPDLPEPWHHDPPDFKELGFERYILEHLRTEHPDYEVHL